MNIIDCEQRSDQWRRIRLGKVTASRIADLTARTKTGWGASRANYMSELIVERLTGVPAEGYQNAAMQWGNDKEPEARSAYELAKGTWVTEVGFVGHPAIEWAGASPDGIVDDSGLLEIKCPTTATHLDTLLGGSIPSKYIGQMQWQMACAGRDWCDFVSFDPRPPARLQLFVKRVHRDEKMIAELEQQVRDFLSELQDKLDALSRLCEAA